jgi:hypothetical protein
MSPSATMAAGSAAAAAMATTRRRRWGGGAIAWGRPGRGGRRVGHASLRLGRMVARVVLHSRGSVSSAEGEHARNRQPRYRDGVHARGWGPDSTRSKICHSFVILK